MIGLGRMAYPKCSTHVATDCNCLETQVYDLKAEVAKERASRFRYQTIVHDISNVVDRNRFDVTVDGVVVRVAELMERAIAVETTGIETCMRLNKKLTAQRDRADGLLSKVGRVLSDAKARRDYHDKVQVYLRERGLLGEGD